jgi:hypothetical protein
MKRFAVLACAAVLLTSVRHTWPGFIDANQSIRYFLTVSMVEDHTLQIDRALARYGSRNYDRAERAGHAYADKPPGTSVLAVPVYWAWARLLHPGDERPPRPPDRIIWWLALAVSLAPMLACAAMLARVLERTGAGPRAAAITSLGLLVATPLAIYSTLFFGHATAAAALGIAFFAVASAPLPLRPGRAAWVGLGCAIGVACEYTVAIPAALLVLVVLRRGGWRATLACLGGALPIAAALAAYHTVAFGGPFSTGYAWKAAPDLAAHHGKGLLGFEGPHAKALFGLLLSRQRGLFFLSPWLVLAVPGLWVLLRDPARRDLGGFVTLTTVVAFLLVYMTEHWHGGDCVGPRYVVFVVPLLAYAAAFAPRVLPAGMPGRALIAVGLGLGMVGLAQLWLPFATFPFHAVNVPDPIYTVSLPLLLGGHVGPSLLPWPLVAFLPPLVALVATVLLAGRRSVLELTLALASAVLFVTGAVTTSAGSTPAALAARAEASSLMMARNLK